MDAPRIPRFLQLPEFFPVEAGVQLLDYAIANETRFEAARFGRSGEVDSSVRHSRRLPDIGPFQKDFERKLLDHTPEFLKKLGLASFITAAVETELVAHGEGAFYAPHIDTDSDALRRRTRRMLSLVYYFHSKPKSFSGGALRIHPFGGLSTDSADFVEVLPQDNLLLVFPSWILHEVRPVACPSGRFRDSRFAVNVWLRQASPEALQRVVG